MKLKFTYYRVWLLAMGMFLCSVVQAQNIKITGQVIASDDRSPLPGVTVMVKGTMIGTQTDVNGAFSIKATNGQVLVFRFVSYSPIEVKVNNQSDIKVSLVPENKTLKEVLVLGYTTQSRATVTSAVAKLDQQVLATEPRANVASALQGTVSGLQVISQSGQPGAAPLITLRGGASFSSPAQPLIVVDGVVRSYNDIPEEDIASVDVLKDAAATAIYGSRASNGVILITLKKGKQGSGEINYKYTTGFNQNRQGYQFLDAQQYIYYGRLGGVASGRTLAAINSSAGYGLSTTPTALAQYDIQESTPANQYLLKQGWQLMNDPAVPGTQIIFKDNEKEIQDMLFRNTQTEDHYLSASGGNDKGTYYSSLDYYHEPGVVIGSDYKRYTGNFNGSYKVKPNVEITSGLTFSDSQNAGPVASDLSTFYRTLSLQPTFNPWLNAANTVPDPGNSASDGNPLYYLQHKKNSNEVDNIVANAAVNWKIIPGLAFKLSGSGYYYQNLVQSFTEETQSIAQMYTTPPGGNTTRAASATYNRSFTQTYDGTLNYTKSFGKNNFNLLAGGEYYDISTFYSAVSGTNAPTDNIPTVNASTLFAAGTGNESLVTNFRIISSFASLNYDYDQKYLFNAVLREDGVSAFAAQNRIGYFPGMSAGWNIAKEDFFQNSGVSKIISTIKPRISYGENGNVGTLQNSPYLYQGTYNATTNYPQYNGNGAITATQLPDPGLQWEKSTTKDAGIDLGFLHDRISLMVDYYDKINSNLLTSLTLPTNVGFSSILTNDGTYQNKGIEFTLKANLINSPGGFRLDFGATASYDKNKILKLPNNGQPNNGVGTIQVYDAATGKLINVEGEQQGQAPGEVYGYKELGIFQSQAQIQAVAGNRIDKIGNVTGPNVAAGTGGHIVPGDVNWEDVNGDGIIDSRDQVRLGNILPTWTGGYNFNAAYKGFSLYTRFDFSLGNIIYNDFVARSLGQYQGTFNMINEMTNSWSPTHTNTMIPRVTYADQVVGSGANYTRANNANAFLNGENSQFYESGNYTACREISLSYNFPKALLAKSHVFKSARVFVSGENLFYIKSFSGPDPEAPVTAGTNSINGIYQGTYPTPRTYVLGVSVSL
ncbi:MAG: SusC/RagA family TonB-linked outer membrane protein [Sphingobacteriales bacterium]